MPMKKLDKGKYQEKSEMLISTYEKKKLFRRLCHCKIISTFLVFLQVFEGNFIRTGSY